MKLIGKYRPADGRQQRFPEVPGNLRRQRIHSEDTDWPLRGTRETLNTPRVYFTLVY